MSNLLKATKRTLTKLGGDCPVFTEGNIDMIMPHIEKLISDEYKRLVKQDKLHLIDEWNDSINETFLNEAIGNTLTKLIIN